MTSPQSLIKALTEIEPIKTWSLIVTLFGDLDSTAISGKDLGLLLELVGVKPEARRVALHRLKKDGWIISVKTGREVTYSLSKYGLSETSAVYEDIYRQDIKYPQGWSLFLSQDDVEIEAGLPISRNLWLIPNSVKIPVQNVIQLQFDNSNIPPWFVAKLTPPEMVERAGHLGKLAAQARAMTLNKQDMAAIRLLSLHHWRKLALRDMIWASLWLHPNSALAHCHQNVTQLLHELPKLPAGQLQGALKPKQVSTSHG